MLLTPVTTFNGKPIEQFSAEMGWVVRGEDVLGLEVKVRAAGETALHPVFLPLDAEAFIETFPAKTTRKYTPSGGYKQRHYLHNFAGMYGQFTRAKSALCDGMGVPSVGGNLTIYYDSVTKLFREPGAYADVVAKMRAASMGPEYHVVPAPGDAMEVLGNADYPKYNFARYDCSPGVDTVKRTFLLQKMDNENARLALPAELGPYCHRWVREGGDDVLYYAGYTGVARLRYRIAGKVPERHQVEVLTLPHQPADGAPDGPIKWFSSICPGVGDTMFLTGYSQTARGGTAYSGGLLWFDRRAPKQLAKVSEMSRGYNTLVLVGRLRGAPGGRLEQDLLLSGNYNAAAAETILANKRPANTKPRLFVYRYGGADGVRDLFGFTLAPAEGKGAAGVRDVAMSANGLYLLLLMTDGVLATFDLDALRFVDAVRAPPLFASFTGDRHNAELLPLPDGDFLLGLLEKKDPADANEQPTAALLVRVGVDAAGRIQLTPQLRCTFAAAADLAAPAAFVYDARKNDGSYDAVFGPNPAKAEGAVRIIRDFLPPRR